MNNKRQFGELETLILQELKKKKKATVKDIHFLLKNSIAYTTIMTVMYRLFEKKILKREKQGRSFIYWLSDSNYFSKFLDKVKKKLFSENSVEIVSYLLKNNSQITQDELNKIDKLIQQMKRDKNK